MKLDDYLRQFAAPLPSWLEQFRCGDAFNLDHFLNSRVVFYPGSGFDGHPVKVFGSTHSAHCFVYADYGMSEQSLLKELSLSKYRFRGYRTLARIRLTAQQVQSCGKSPRISSGQSSDFNISGSFGFVEILEREQGHDDCHGAQRLAVLFLGADGFAAFDAIFGPQHNAPPPFCIVLVDANRNLTSL